MVIVCWKREEIASAGEVGVGNDRGIEGADYYDDQSGILFITSVRSDQGEGFDFSTASDFVGECKRQEGEDAVVF